MQDNIMVSISCITYNHHAFIRDAIKGFLMQETDFEYEILIHDDASTDGTAEIIREYTRAKSTRGLFRAVFQEENTFSKTGLYPFLMPLAKGKYVAFCDGDDYWTDPLKLQKQVDFMEAHPEYSMCYHDHVILNIEGFFEKPSAHEPQHYTAEELIAWHNKGYGIAYSTKLIRNYYNEDTAADFSFCRDDYYQNVLMGLFGPCRYIEGIKPSIYRKHASNSWCRKTQKEIAEKTRIANHNLYEFVAAKNRQYAKLRERLING